MADSRNEALREKSLGYAKAALTQNTKSLPLREKDLEAAEKRLERAITDLVAAKARRDELRSKVDGMRESLDHLPPAIEALSDEDVVDDPVLFQKARLVVVKYSDEIDGRNLKVSTAQGLAYLNSGF